MTKHPHHEIITAYLEGKEIEIQDGEGQWSDVPPFSKLNAIPAFWKERVYRVKPITRFYQMKFSKDKFSNSPTIRELEHWETPDLIVTTIDGTVTKVDMVV